MAEAPNDPKATDPKATDPKAADPKANDPGPNNGPTPWGDQADGDTDEADGTDELDQPDLSRPEGLARAYPVEITLDADGYAVRRHAPSEEAIREMIANANLNKERGGPFPLRRAGHDRSR